MQLYILHLYGVPYTKTCFLIMDALAKQILSITAFEISLLYSTFCVLCLGLINRSWNGIPHVDDGKNKNMC